MGGGLGEARNARHRARDGVRYLRVVLRRVGRSRRRLVVVERRRERLLHCGGRTGNVDPVSRRRRHRETGAPQPLRDRGYLLRRRAEALLYLRGAEELLVDRAHRIRDVLGVRRQPGVIPPGEEDPRGDFGAGGGLARGVWSSIPDRRWPDPRSRLQRPSARPRPIVWSPRRDAFVAVVRLWTWWHSFTRSGMRRSPGRPLVSSLAQEAASRCADAC